MFFYLDQRRELSFFSTCFFFPFVVVVVVVVVFFFVELCRPVLYDVRNQSSFIAGGGEGEVGAFWRDHMVFRGDGWGAVVSNRF